MRIPNEIVEMKLADLLSVADDIGTEVAPAAEEVAQIEKELVAADKIYRELNKESKLISNFAQAMLSANGNATKQQKVKEKYLKLLTKNYIARQEAEKSLEESRNAVRELIEGLPDQIAEITKQVVAKHEQGEKTQPEPVVLPATA